MTNTKKMVEKAFNFTETAAAEYLHKKLLEQHFEHSDERAGSFFTGFHSKKELQDAILNAEWNVHEGSLEEGKVILHTSSLKGKSGIKLLSDCLDFSEKPSEQIEGRVEYVSYISSENELPETTDTWLIISTYSPQTESVDIEKPFIPTFFPGDLIGPNDTVVGTGMYAKLVKK